MNNNKNKNYSKKILNSKIVILIYKCLNKFIENNLFKIRHIYNKAKFHIITGLKRKALLRENIP